jgi:hypothetical protein
MFVLSLVVPVDWGYKGHLMWTRILHQLLQFSSSWKWSSYWWQRLINITINIQSHLTMMADTTSKCGCTGDIHLFGHNNTNRLTAEQFFTLFCTHIMKCDMFLHILRFLHFNDNVKPE